MALRNHAVACAFLANAVTEVDVAPIEAVLAAHPEAFRLDGPSQPHPLWAARDAR